MFDGIGSVTIHASPDPQSGAYNHPFQEHDMIRWIRNVSLPLAAATFFACNQGDRVSQTESDGRTGSASIRLPALPSNYLAKTSASAKAIFSLSITGPSMQPIQKSWVLSSDTASTFTVTGIPVGYLRLFSGRLLKISSKGDTVEAHFGSDTARIVSDTVAQVRLRLNKSGLGAADVCVEVEGWATDSSCVKIKPAPFNLTGCYSVLISKSDSLGFLLAPELAKLSLTQSDTLVHAILKWSSGRVDSAKGIFSPQMTLFLGPWNGTDTAVHNGSFYLKAGFSQDRSFGGDLTLDNQRSYQMISGVPTSCDASDGEPRACYSVSRELRTAPTESGRLILRATKVGSWGYFQWNGIYSIIYPTPMTGSNLDTARVQLRVEDAKTPQNIAEYNLQLRPRGTAEGYIYAAPEDTAQIGRWRATRSACTTQEPI